MPGLGGTSVANSMSAAPNYCSAIAWKFPPHSIRVVLLVSIVATVLIARCSFFYGRFLGDEISEDQDYQRCRRRLH
jgi:hypothetical protein